MFNAKAFVLTVVAVGALISASAPTAADPSPTDTDSATVAATEFTYKTQSSVSDEQMFPAHCQADGLMVIPAEPPEV